MTDHANELRRYARKIAHPAGDVPSVMLAAADEIERLAARLEEAESDALEQARLNGMGGEREAALMAKLEAAEKSDAESLAMYRRARDERDALRAKLEEAEENRSHFLVKIGKLYAQCDALHAKIEQMEKQEPFDADSDVFRGAFEAALKAGNWPATRKGDGYRSPSAQIAWRIAFSTVNRLKLYLAPGAQPAPSVPTESIGKMLAQAMDAAVANGANSVSMPDELVEVAAWLSGVQPNPVNGQTRAVRDVIAERRRQVETEGWTPEHDDEHGAGEMAAAAACYALNAAGCGCEVARNWPWDGSWWKPTTSRRDLVKAGALVLAEIERLDRAEAPKPEGE